MITLSRTDTSVVGRWWWTVDRWLLIAIALLIGLGGVLTLAASPAVASRIGLAHFHFVQRQAVFLAPALVIMFGVSLMSPTGIRRLATMVFCGALVLVAATLFSSVEVKGANRWLYLGGLSLQPSEFVKPAFVILVSWLFAESARRPEMPANTVAIALLLSVIVLLVLQPDFGQTMLIALVWSALFFMAGMRWIWVFGLGGTAVIGLVTAYYTIPHVAKRINRFMDPSSGDTFNVDVAIESFVRGGWFGTGPGEGTVKRVLPESHTDFVFAVAAEEFGVVLCLILVALFALVVIRSLVHALRDDDPFSRFAVAGLAMLFGSQSAVNMAVNLHLMPAKGMTLPFVSYGGSSLISLAYGMGMLLALTRERPRAEQLGSGNGFAPALGAA